MFLKKLTDLFSSKKSDEATPAETIAPSRPVDVTKLPLFDQLDDTARYMVNQHQQFIRQHITFINHWVGQNDIFSAAEWFIQLKWVDYLNPEIPKFEQNAHLMAFVRTLPQQPDQKKLHCAFRKVHPDMKYGKDMFQITDDGYKIIVTSRSMPNRADIKGEAWRTREKTPDDVKYYDTVREIIFHYYMNGFDNVDHQLFERPKKD